MATAKKPMKASLSKTQINKIKAMPKPKTSVGSVAKTFDVKKLIPKMTPQDKAMLNILKKKYGENVYKG
jgi:hypothetical protein